MKTLAIHSDCKHIANVMNEFGEILIDCENSKISLFIYYLYDKTQGYCFKFQIGDKSKETSYFVIVPYWIPFEIMKKIVGLYYCLILAERS